MHKDEIDDNEIRIITGGGTPRRWRRYRIYIIAVLIVAVSVASGWGVSRCASGDSEGSEAGTLEVVAADVSAGIGAEADSAVIVAVTPARGYATVVDTVVNRVPLMLITPHNATPVLCIGDSVLSDTTAVLVAQAADIRSDNGGIVGAYVLEGKLISSGKSKSGFCAIINGKPTIGVADATPCLEQAIDNGGYFFRQYPLVVGGQTVENKPRNSSLRKALAELNGEIVVILSRNRMTLNEFSKTLVDLGVSNAIYLVGSEAYGFAGDGAGNRLEFGKRTPQSPPNTNYIVWR